MKTGTCGEDGEELEEGSVLGVALEALDRRQAQEVVPLREGRNGRRHSPDGALGSKGFGRRSHSGAAGKCRQMLGGVGADDSKCREVMCTVSQSCGNLSGGGA